MGTRGVPDPPPAYEKNPGCEDFFTIPKGVPPTGWVQGGYRMGAGWVQGRCRVGAGGEHPPYIYNFLSTKEVA